MSDIKQASVHARKQRAVSQVVVIAIVALAFVISNLFVGGKLLTTTNILNILSHAIYPAIVAWGMMFIFSSGIVDLSIGATIILSAGVGALLVTDYGLGYPGLIIVTIAVAVACEMLSVSCAVYLKIPSWIAGLGLALGYEAIWSIFATARSKTAGSNLVYLKEARALGKEPLIYIVAILVFIAAYLLFNRSSLGLNIQAIGGNSWVAKAMGICEKKNVMLGALVGAVFIGIAAIVQVSYVGKFAPQSGLGSLSGIFKALATVLLAGSVSRIFSQPVGILLGAIVVMGLFNVLTIMGVPSGTGQEICLGVTVIVCGILSNLHNRRVVK